MKQFKLEHSPIVYYLSGRDHPEWLLFLHAAFVDHRMFQKQIDCFRDRYNVLTLDVIGHGNSTDTKKGDSIDKMSGWIREILEKEGIDRIHIVGVSLGAVLAQDFANRCPGPVQSLACFGGYDINNFDAELQKGNGAAQLRMMLKAIVSVKWFAASNKTISAYTPQAQQEFYELNLASVNRDNSGFWLHGGVPDVVVLLACRQAGCVVRLVRNTAMGQKLRRTVPCAGTRERKAAA